MAMALQALQALLLIAVSSEGVVCQYRQVKDKAQPGRPIRFVSTRPSLASTPLA